MPKNFQEKIGLDLETLLDGEEVLGYKYYIILTRKAIERKCW
jgi:hypothetical protein